MSNNTGLIIKHPKLALFFASKNPLWGALKLSPIIIYLVCFISAKTNITHIALAFISGILTWSFVEYAIHRWLYHIKPSTSKMFLFIDAFHQYHHREMSDHRVLNAGWLMIYPGAILTWVMTNAIVNNPTITSSFSLGLLTYYYFYEIVHYFIHYKVFTSGYFMKIQKYHLYHHYHCWSKNYGNTITLWDRIFSTYDKRYLNFSWTKEQLNHLIKQE